MTIKKIEVIKNKNRYIKITLTNKTKLRIDPYADSWIMTGGCREERSLCVSLAEHLNDWLHGGELWKFILPE